MSSHAPCLVIYLVSIEKVVCHREPNYDQNNRSDILKNPSNYDQSSPEQLAIGCVFPRPRKYVAFLFGSQSRMECQFSFMENASSLHLPTMWQTFYKGGFCVRKTQVPCIKFKVLHNAISILNVHPSN